MSINSARGSITCLPILSSESSPSVRPLNMADRQIKMMMVKKLKGTGIAKEAASSSQLHEVAFIISILIQPENMRRVYSFI